MDDATRDEAAAGGLEVADRVAPQQPDRNRTREPGGTSAATAAGVPARAEGLELLGEYEESGFDDPPSLVRRRDGQVIQLTDLLFTVLSAVDGQRNPADISREVSAQLGRHVTPENVQFLLDEKLRPLGVLKGPDGSEPQLKKVNPLLALRARIVLSSERMTNRITRPFAALFHFPIVAIVIAGFIAVSCWVLLFRGLAQGTREALYSPELLILLFVLTVLSAGFHEFGHAAACRYSGATPGVMGAGIYLVWPAFYTDVTDAYRLGRRGRLRTDLGGLYFNAIFLLAIFGVWAATGNDAFLLAVPLQLFQMMHQLLPFVRMDGYYILSDITGVPDLFSRIKPTLQSAVPGRELDERAAPLKRWVRIVVTTWVLVVIPLLIVSLVLAVITLPRLAATAFDSLAVIWRDFQDAIDAGRWTTVAAEGLSMIALVLPIASVVYMLVRMTRRVLTKLWTSTDGRPVRRGAGLLTAAAAVAGLAWLWWPNGEYRPIQAAERGTLFDGLQSAGNIGTGRPGLTSTRAVELDGAPNLRDVDPAAPGDPLDPDAPVDEPDDEGVPDSSTTSTVVAPAPGATGTDAGDTVTTKPTHTSATDTAPTELSTTTTAATSTTAAIASTAPRPTATATTARPPATAAPSPPASASTTDLSSPEPDPAPTTTKRATPVPTATQTSTTTTTTTPTADTKSPSAEPVVATAGPTP